MTNAQVGLKDFFLKSKYTGKEICDAIASHLGFMINLETGMKNPDILAEISKIINANFAALYENTSSYGIKMDKKRILTGLLISHLNHLSGIINGIKKKHPKENK